MIQYYKNQIRNHYRNRVSKKELLTLEGAFMDVERLYQGQFRFSGLPVALHSLRVGALLCRLNADIHTTIAGLLHDVLEDTHISQWDLRIAYGPWYAEMSEALKKTHSTRLTHQKILQAGRHDIRSLMIKFCDRLDNMREIHWLPLHKRRRISRESLQFYLPFASRLSAPSWMKEELKSLAVRFS